MVLELVASDPAVAEEVAEYLHELEACDRAATESVLAAHPDPVVRAALARNREIAPSTLAALASNGDTGVAAIAASFLPNSVG
ncbi:MAG: hypothetical protein HYX36_02120 [Rhizobiales bacterium]|nr:hypothetical protein [Hyphomicrobiales bacterium]